MPSRKQWALITVYTLLAAYRQPPDGLAGIVGLLIGFLILYAIVRAYNGRKTKSEDDGATPSQAAHQ